MLIESDSLIKENVNKFVCKNCGHEFLSTIAKCPNCDNQFNIIKEGTLLIES